MKKLFTMLAVAMVAMSCEGPMGPMGPQGSAGRNGENGKDGKDGKLQKVSVSITVPKQAWVREVDSNGDFLQYTYLMDRPELTSEVIDNGFFYTYFCWNDGDILVQEGTGYTYYQKTSDGDFYSITIATDYSVGAMKFYVSPSDFFDERPETMEFRFVAIW